MTRCALTAPRSATGGRVDLTCRIEGAARWSTVQVRISVDRGGQLHPLESIAIRATSSGAGFGECTVRLDDRGGVPVTLVAVPYTRGEPGASATAVVTML